MKNKYGEELTPIVTNGFLQVNEMKLDDDIYQLTKEEKRIIIKALTHYWYKEKTELTDELMDNLIDKLGE